MALFETGLRMPERAVPGRWDALLFALKCQAFRVARFARELGRRLPRLAHGSADDFTVTLAQTRSALWSDPRPGERAMQWGKVHNLRAAARRLDRTLIPADAVFSFWRQLGRASARKGFVAGRMLQEGCLVPARGGGLCQLSNALYDAALNAGCAIVERHPHSRAVPGAQSARGRDATVAWNYVDLRFAAPRPLLLRVTVEREALMVRLMARDGAAASHVSHGVGAAAAPGCGECGQTACFRHEGGRAAPDGRRAVLVDENWPELRSFVAREGGDALALPMAGRGRYGWETGGFARVTSAPLAALRRSLELRLAKSAPARRAAELRGTERLARRAARMLAPDVTEVTVAQSLLPFLWRDGHLGGRRVTVLMTRMPMDEIQARLDAAAARHPERASLRDFRAEPGLVAAEREALAAAERIVTPHAQIAALFAGRAVRLGWRRPQAVAQMDARVARRIAFPGPVLARKGAYALRDAARALDLEVVLCGGDLEGAEFWNGVRTRRAGDDWLDGVSAVVQPALLEDAPRRLLQALAAGVPAIATPACGLPEQDGLVLVAQDDADALIAALAGL